MPFEGFPCVLKPPVIADQSGYIGNIAVPEPKRTETQDMKQACTEQGDTDVESDKENIDV